MPDAILTDIPTDGELFEPEVESKDEQAPEKPAESSTEKSETDKAPSQEGAKEEDDVSGETTASKSNTSDENQIPFNKHPRWKELQEQNDFLKSELENLKNTVGSFTPKLEALETQREQLKEVKIPKLFTDVYGDDAKAHWEEYRQEIDAQIKAAQLEVYNSIQAEKQAQTEESQRWNAWMVDSMKRVEQTYEVSMPEGSSDRNEFLKYVLKYKPTDDNGNIDFVLGYELFSQSKEAERSKKSEKNNARKSIAAVTTSEKGAEPKTVTSNTHKNLRSKSFLDLALESLNES
jgi:hypothetical protein